MNTKKYLPLVMLFFIVAISVAASGCIVKIEIGNDSSSSSTTIPTSYWTSTSSAEYSSVPTTTTTTMSKIVVEMPLNVDSLEVTFYFVTGDNFSTPPYVFNGTEYWNNYQKCHCYHGAVASIIDYRVYHVWSMSYVNNRTVNFTEWGYGVWSFGNVSFEASTSYSGAGADDEWEYHPAIFQVLHVDGDAFTSNGLLGHYYTTYYGRYWLILRFMGMRATGVDAYGTLFVPLSQVDGSTYTADLGVGVMFVVATDASFFPSGTEPDNVSVGDYNHSFRIATMVGHIEVYEPPRATYRQFDGTDRFTATFYSNLSVPEDLYSYFSWYWDLS